MGLSKPQGKSLFLLCNFASGHKSRTASSWIYDRGVFFCLFSFFIAYEAFSSGEYSSDKSSEPVMGFLKSSFYELLW